MTDAGAPHVAALGRVLRLARVLENRELTSAARAMPRLLGDMHVYGVTPDNDVVAAANGRVFILHEGHTGLSVNGKPRLEQLQAQLRTLPENSAALRAALADKQQQWNGRKVHRLIGQLLTGGLDALYDTPWDQVATRAVQQHAAAQPVHRSTGKVGRAGAGQITTSSTRPFWNDPEQQNWH